MKKSTLSYIYLHSPVFLQNALITARGYFLYKKRRLAGVYKPFLEKLFENEKKDAAYIKEFQLSSMRRLIAYARTCIPYYRDLFKEHNVHEDDFSRLEDIHKIPLLNKETLRKDETRFIPDRNYGEKPIGKIFSLHTSGTTGKPLTVYTNSEARQKNYAFFSRFLSWAGLSDSSRKATFGGNIIVSQHQKKPPFWRYDFARSNLFMSSYHMSEDNLPYYIDALSEFQPELIESYPSSIYVIAAYIVKHNINSIRPRAIVTSAETLHDGWRKTIEDAFQCKVFDQYGCTEMALFVGQCEKGAYHVHSDYGIVEVLRDGKEQTGGEVGEIVCTGFVNDVMPLIRYRIGDVGALSSSGCSCGRPFPVLKSIQGRMDEFIVTNDNRLIGRMDPILKGGLPIKACQFIQEHKSGVKVLVEKAEGYDQYHTEILLKEIKKRLGYEMDISVEFRENLIRDKEKFRAVISNVKLELN